MQSRQCGVHSGSPQSRVSIRHQFLLPNTSVSNSHTKMKFGRGYKIPTLLLVYLSFALLHSDNSTTQCPVTPTRSQRHIQPSIQHVQQLQYTGKVATPQPLSQAFPLSSDSELAILSHFGTRQSCNTSLMSAKFSKAHFHSWLKTLRSSVIDHTYTRTCTMHLKCTRLTLRMHIPSIYTHVHVLGECSAQWGEHEQVEWCTSVSLHYHFAFAYISHDNTVEPLQYGHPWDQNNCPDQ